MTNKKFKGNKNAQVFDAPVWAKNLRITRKLCKNRTSSSFSKTCCNTDKKK
jgi:hypothetical protein